ncbi:G-protein coupled receptor-associated protein LMBRD2-like [Paramacrobiotus metropolitanus]|uniref:G-protein coupled receptor-associated protein LMBRD2-like n=1 Tax=Paramacrobiotus metropolitanus TaxID=2943436 RepID=UPI00244637E5|nr:G-protein coupled receptor-associated protein LMBRD2-like [Paramacrobiotus metropolitanus]
MQYFILACLILLVFVITASLLYQYGSWRKQHICVTATVFLAWYFSFLIIFIIPTDVSTTVYEHCVKNATYLMNTTAEDYHIDSESNADVSITGFKNHSLSHIGMLNWNIAKDPNAPQYLSQSQADCLPPWSYFNGDDLPHLWLVLYWSTQVLTWLVLPLMQTYALAGEFSFYGKITTSIKRNVISYGTYTAVFAILLIYVAMKPGKQLNWEKVYTIMTSASNSLGLFMLILLLGYGLVEFPRNFWKASDLEYQLAFTQFKLAKVRAEKADAEEETETVLEDIRQAVEKAPVSTRLRKDLNVIVAKCPEEFRLRVLNPNKIGPPPSNRFVRISTTTPDLVVNNALLVSLHTRLISALHKQFKITSVWYGLLENGFEYEDCLHNLWSPDKTFRASYPIIRSKWMSKLVTPRIEWFWKCKARQWTLKIFSVCLSCCSLVVVWSECTFFVQEPVLSTFAILVKVAASHKTYVNVELVSFCIIAYMSVCAYYTVFHIRIFDYYNLSLRHQTDENSLIFCGILLCRLTPPLCLNFLGLIHMDSHIIPTRTAETAFTRIMGHMTLLPIISRGLNIYFPIFVVLLCGCTFLRLERKLLNFFGYQQYTSVGKMTTYFILEGRKIMEAVRSDRRVTQKLEETRAVRDELLQLVNNTSNFGHISNEESETEMDKIFLERDKPLVVA